jgi:hypothetical protein
MDNSISQKWIPYAELQQYFNYKPTQMAALLKDATLKVAKIGKRKFIERESLEAFLEKKASRQ